ncbi:hypothetical protein S83_018187 [Arachis hypogaea]
MQINIDVVFNEKVGKRTVAMVFRNSDDRIRGGATTTIEANSALMAEACAMKEALILPKNLDIGKSLVESNFLSLVELIKSRGECWEIDVVLQDMRFHLDTATRK